MKRRENTANVSTNFPEGSQWNQGNAYRTLKVSEKINGPSYSDVPIFKLQARNQPGQSGTHAFSCMINEWCFRPHCTHTCVSEMVI